MNIRRLQQVIQYGWKDASSISQDQEVGKGKLGIFCDILFCFLKYNVWSNQYKKEKLYALTGEEKKAICLKYQEKNTKRDRWVKAFFDNYKFLHKWTKFKYETSSHLQAKRLAAYKKQYGLGEKCFIGYDVIFHRHHYEDSQITTGKCCQISEHVDIDYTGGLVIGEYVNISEGAKILTHNHDMNLPKEIDEKKNCVLTPLTIQNTVWIGAKAIIMPGVTEIGRCAVISANSLITKKVPPYAIMQGNPAKIVGFRLSVEEIVEYESWRYPEEERLPIELLRKNYEKYFLSRWKQIKEWNKM